MHFPAMVIASLMAFALPAESSTSHRLEDRDYTWIAMVFLGREELHKELSCSDEQVSRLKDLVTEWRSPRWMLRPPKKVREMSAEEELKWNHQRAIANKRKDEVFRKQIDSILTQEQRTRLNEVLVQRCFYHWGMTVAADAELKGPLMVTDEQRGKLLAIRSRWLVDIAGRDEAVRERARKKLDTEAGEVLTAEQQALLKTLQGAPFDVKALLPRK